MTAELRVRQILYVAPTRQAGVRTPTANAGTEILAQTTVLVIKMLTTVKLLQLPRPLLMMLAVVTGTFSVLNMLLLLLLLMMMILTMMTILMKMKFDEVVLPLQSCTDTLLKLMMVMTKKMMNDDEGECHCGCGGPHDDPCSVCRGR